MSCFELPPHSQVTLPWLNIKVPRALQQLLMAVMLSAGDASLDNI